MDGVAVELRAPDLPERVFRRVAELAYEVAGIKLPAEKRELVRSRLIKRVRHLHLDGFEDYLALVDSPRGQDELPRMIDALTTNKTNFFRESAHFDFLAEVVLPEARAARRLRIWSAACSSGEEPYTIAMVLAATIRDLESWDVRILATDISERMIDLAERGLYRKEQLEGVSPADRERFFSPAGGEFSVRNELRALVRFARLNLMQDWPMRGPFDLVFCRNVMIYFDKPTQERLVNRFFHLLRPGGYLAVGHSESLTPLSHPYQFIQPATYRRPLD
jgi:chemotaxis protein methyltransferase CheR